jgi:hypothetical protein
MENESANEPKRRYRWPWVVMAALILWVLLAVVWMRAAVLRVEEERSISAPPSANSSH